GVKSVVAPEAGIVTHVLVQVGDVIYKDREVVRLARPVGSASAEEPFLVSRYAGRVLELLVKVGNAVEKGTVLLILEPIDDNLEALIYVPVGNGQKVDAGMPVRIAPATVKKNEFGYLLGQVAAAAK